MVKAYLVGSGIASLAAAAFLIRDGGFAGSQIHLLAAQDLLDDVRLGRRGVC